MTVLTYLKRHVQAKEVQKIDFERMPLEKKSWTTTSLCVIDLEIVNPANKQHYHSPFLLAS
jgi:hypothetical protein